MNKRGQLTVFIVVAIVIVAGLLIYLSVRPGFKVSVDPEVVPIYNFVQNCVDKSAEDAIYYIGQYGGYYIVPERSSEEAIPYYFENGKSYLLSKVQLEFELSKAMNDLLFFCYQNFASFPDFDIKQGEIESKVIIQKEKITFEAISPLSINKGELTISLESFTTEIPSNLLSIYEVASFIVEEQVKNKDAICVNCLSEISLEKEIYISFFDHPNDEDTIIFELIDEDKKINGEDYRYYFAHRLS